MNGATGVRHEQQRKGRLITFEGGEGSGKSTQVKRLVTRLAGQGIETLATREPGGSPGAERLREVILSGAVKPFGPEAEALMFAAARIDHVEKTIMPALNEGCFVVCDRYIDSTRAYQGASGAVSKAFVDALEKAVTADAMPDLTIVLDLDVAEGLRRAGLRRADAATDRFEAEGTAFHEKVRQAFLAMAASDPLRFVVIDASASPDEIEAAVWRAVASRLLSVRETTPPSPPKLKVIEGGESGFEKPAAKPRNRTKHKDMPKKDTPKDTP